MPSFLTIAGTLIAAYALTYIYAFVRNAFNGRETGFPTIWVPWHPQFIIWILISPPLRGWFEQHLPTRIFNRLTLCIYGWEFFQRFKPFDDYCGAQADLKTFMLVTCGRLEMYTSNAEVVAQILARPRDFMQLDIGNWIVSRSTAFSRALLTVCRWVSSVAMFLPATEITGHGSAKS